MAVVHRDGLEVRKVSCGPYDNNVYVLVCPKTKQSVIVDTPLEPEKALAEAKGTKVVGILLTHCHQDHILGHKQIREATGAPVWVHPTEASALPVKPDHAFGHNGSVSFGTITLKTIHVPGHTTGGTALLWGDQLFSGDVLFPNGPGKTWSVEAFKQLVTNLRERIFTLPDDVRVYPGHGSDTVLGREKEQFRQFESRPHKPDLHGDVLWLRD
ncbi:MAG: MBL fold metallo-hydrolase [Chloroflexi bacterium]|nr:MBL fold metallo-hydrolase [Chloroflexota bacterium]